MKEYSQSRRSALRGLGFVLGAGAVGLDFSEMARAAHDAHLAAASPGSATFTLLDAADAADIDALASRIVPSDDLPGAREAGAVYFIDRALGSFLAHWRDSFMGGLRDFQSAARAFRPQGKAFSAFTPDEQTEFLRIVDTTPFFDQARTLTLCGLFTSPKYGGNRDGTGWKILGFEDQHVFEPPFGWYDRDVEAGGAT